MHDDELLPKVAALYGKPDARIERGPRRAFGFHGLIVITPTDGPKIIVKQNNWEEQPVSKLRQTDLRFHQRCFALGFPTPAPVEAIDGTHGSINVRDDERSNRCYYMFEAEEHVEGVGLLKAPVRGKLAERLLETAGNAGALARVASRGVGPWRAFPFGTLNEWLVVADSAGALAKPWAKRLRDALPALVTQAETLPLGDGFTYFGLYDFGPEDTMLTDSQQLVFTDFERIHPYNRPEPMISFQQQWLGWAASCGVSEDKASRIIQGSFNATLRKHGLSVPYVAPRAQPEFERRYLALQESTRLAIHPRIGDFFNKDGKLDAEIPRLIDEMLALTRPFQPEFSLE